MATTKRPDANDIAREHGQAGLRAEFDGARREQANGETPPTSGAKLLFPFTWWKDVVAAPLKDPLRLVEGLIGERSIVLIWGPSTVGKSFLIISLCAAIAQGILWFGYKCLTGSVLYVALEGEEGFSNRIKAYTLAFLNRGDDGIEGALPFAIINEQINFGPNDADHGDPANNPSVQRLIATAKDVARQSGLPVRAVVYDNFRTATPGLHGNYDEEVAGFYAKVKYINQHIGGASFVIHNAGKDASRGARGSQFHQDVADVELEAKEVGGKRSFEVIKVRDGKAGALYGFAIDQISLGTVEGIDGAAKEVFSCVVRQTEAPKGEAKKETPKWVLAVEALRAAIIENPIYPTDKKHYPSGVACCSRAMFEKELENRGLVAASEPKEVKDEADRARKMAGNLRGQHSYIRTLLMRLDHYAEYKGICWCPEDKNTNDFNCEKESEKSFSPSRSASHRGK